MLPDGMRNATSQRVCASLVTWRRRLCRRLARGRGIPFYCWKTVTDIATEELPDFNLFWTRRGSCAPGGWPTYALTRPRYVAPLLRMGKNGRAGADALSETLRRWIDEGKYADSNG